MSEKIQSEIPLVDFTARDLPDSIADFSNTESGTTLPPHTSSQASASQPDDVSVAPLITIPRFAWVALGLLFLVFIGIGASYFWVTSSGKLYQGAAEIMTVLWVLAGAGTLSLLYWLWSEFQEFCEDLSSWANTLRRGEYSTRMPVSNHQSASRHMRQHINDITEKYEDSEKARQHRVDMQAQHIEQKKHYLAVVYDVAKCINKANNLDDLLQRFLFVLKDIANAEAATVRLMDGDNEMRLVASFGLKDEILAQEQTLPAPNCLCGKAVSGKNLLVQRDLTQCGMAVGHTFFDDPGIEMLAIPLTYRDRVLGIYNLFINRENVPVLEEEQALLESIGQHIGMAIESSNVQDDMKKLSIIEERTRIAHELHDSLAQTLASLRYKIRLFDDTLRQDKEEAIWSELESLETTIDDANIELRSIISEFRAPIDGKGVARAVERLVDRFRQETHMDVFFYHSWNFEKLPKGYRTEVVRIVQEALSNIKKHSQAENVKILMYSSESGNCSVLVEDDGIGIGENRAQYNKDTGEHIGLSVMRERAARLNGEISFDNNDEGQGTLVQLNFDVIVPTVDIDFSPLGVNIDDVKVSRPETHE